MGWRRECTANKPNRCQLESYKQLLLDPGYVAVTLGSKETPGIRRGHCLSFCNNLREARMTSSSLKAQFEFD